MGWLQIAVFTAVVFTSSWLMRLDTLRHIEERRREWGMLRQAREEDHDRPPQRDESLRI